MVDTGLNEGFKKCTVWMNQHFGGGCTPGRVLCELQTQASVSWRPRLKVILSSVPSALFPGSPAPSLFFLPFSPPSFPLLPPFCSSPSPSFSHFQAVPDYISHPTHFSFFECPECSEHRFVTPW